MERSFYKRHNSEWFSGKKAKANRELRNGKGEIIKANEEIELGQKHGRGGFYVKSKSGVSMSCVEPEALDLI